MTKKYKSELKRLIASGKLQKTIEKLVEFSKDSNKLQNKIFAIKYQLESLEESVLNGTSNNAESRSIKGQIVKNLLSLVDSISDNDLFDYVENSETVKRLRQELEDEKRIATKLREENEFFRKELDYSENNASLLKSNLLEKDKLINRLKMFEGVRIVKECERCDGAGKYSQLIQLDFHIIIGRELLYNHTRGGFSFQMKYESLYKDQLQSHIKRYNLTNKEQDQLKKSHLEYLGSISFMAMIKLGLIDRKYKEKLERIKKCHICEGTGITNI